MFIDVDEYLELTNMTLKDYLNMPVFDKCLSLEV